MTRSHGLTAICDTLWSIESGMPISNQEANFRLATYGSLSPGRVNHHELAGLRGNWRQGSVRGKLIPEGWGATLGYPGLILDPLGPPVDAYLFESPDLPHHWARLDEFEGSGYQRVVTRVQTSDGEVDAYIYVLAPADGFPGSSDVGDP